MNFLLLIEVLQPQSLDWFGLFPFRSPLLRKSIFLSFPPVTKMFQFTGLLSHNYWFIMRYLRITVSVFPHSEISGSKFTYNSPKHIVVCHVLHQLLMPRHPPCALNNFSYFVFFLRFFICFSFRISKVSLEISFSFSRFYLERTCYLLII